MDNGNPQKIGLFMNAKDEDNIKEWVAHYILLGFNKIIIFDHNSIEPIKNLFQPFQTKVEIIDCNLEKKVKITLMNDAIIIANNYELDWFIYLDADEFIILNNTNKIHDLINLYKDFDLIGINWVMFGSNFHDSIPTGLIIENYTKVGNNSLNKHIKSIVKTSEVKNAINPHFYIMKNPDKMIGIDYKNITKPFGVHECNLEQRVF
jgi:hypothetical protein